MHCLPRDFMSSKRRPGGEILCRDWIQSTRSEDGMPLAWLWIGYVQPKAIAVPEHLSGAGLVVVANGRKQIVLGSQS
jgi:hypothetical protein